MWEPIQFNPVYQSYIWGGRQIAERFQRVDAPVDGPVAESWEISDRLEGMSVVRGGPLEGRSLRSLMEEFPVELLGKNAGPKVFPLLVKLIDARESLSAQVHPGDEAAAQGMGDAKSEAWYILDARPGACVYRGFHSWVTPQLFEDALRDGQLVDLLIRCSIVPGDTIYIPGGMVHAIGAGCLLLEVQQNSNTTYRLFDWNRTDVEGKPRPLHLEEGRKVVKWDSDESHSPAEGGRCVTPYFSVETLSPGKRPVSLVDPLRGFTILFVEDGQVALRYPLGEVIAKPGSTWLLPAAMKICKAVRHESDSSNLVMIRGVGKA